MPRHSNRTVLLNFIVCQVLSHILPCLNLILISKVVRRITDSIHHIIKQQKHAFGTYGLQRQQDEKQQEHELYLERLE